VQEEAPQGQQAPTVALKRPVVGASEGKLDKVDDKKRNEKEEGASKGKEAGEEAHARRSTSAEAESTTKAKQAQQAVGIKEPSEQAQVTEGANVDLRALEAPQKNVRDEDKQEELGRKIEPSSPSTNKADDEAAAKSKATEVAEPEQRVEEEGRPARAAEEEAAAAAITRAEETLQRQRTRRRQQEKGSLQRSMLPAKEGAPHRRMEYCRGLEALKQLAHNLLMHQGRLIRGR
jgi:hypothetical protein